MNNSVLNLLIEESVTYHRTLLFGVKVNYRIIQTFRVLPDPKLFITGLIDKLILAWVCCILSTCKYLRIPLKTCTCVNKLKITLILYTHTSEASDASRTTSLKTIQKIKHKP